MKKLSEVLTRYGIITAACALYAVGFNWCFDPNHISVGGFTGIAQIINHYLPQLPIGTLALVMNIPLFILGWKKIGKALLFSSLYATAVSSVMIDALAAVHTFQPMDPILACLYGGAICGISFGVMLRQGATTGGTELAARLRTFRHVDLAQIAGVIEDFYGIGVAFRSEALKNIQFTGTLDFNMPIDHILEVLTLSTNTRFNRNGEKITIHK